MKTTALLAILLLLFAGCKKEENAALKPLDYTLTYEVITSTGEWFGAYNDSTGKRVNTGTAMANGWTYTFRLKSLPFTMHVDATTSCGCAGSSTSPDVTINFYSNGVLFKSEKNKWAKGVTSLDFDIAVSVP